MKCHKSICYALSINNEFSNTNMVILSTRHYSDPFTVYQIHNTQDTSTQIWLLPITLLVSCLLPD